MRSRFFVNLAVMVAGWLLLLGAVAFRFAVVGWLALAAGCVVLVTVLVGFACAGRGALQRALDGGMALAGAWTIVASCSFGGATLKWLSFSEAALFAALGLGGLILHEIQLESGLRGLAKRPEQDTLARALASRIP
ncbi:MAG: hypothetical protein ACR2OB_02395 [Solirubrobacteraceae bacterium]